MFTFRFKWQIKYYGRVTYVLLIMATKGFDIGTPRSVMRKCFKGAMDSCDRHDASSANAEDRL